MRTSQSGFSKDDREVLIVSRSRRWVCLADNHCRTSGQCWAALIRPQIGPVRSAWSSKTTFEQIAILAAPRAHVIFHFDFYSGIQTERGGEKEGEREKIKLPNLAVNKKQLVSMIIEWWDNYFLNYFNLSEKTKFSINVIIYLYLIIILIIFD